MKLIGVLLCLLWILAPNYVAAQSAVPMVKMEVDLRDKASLQRGAKYFMNYCAGCHSLKYMRFSQVAVGLGLFDEQGNVLEQLVKDNLIFNKSYKIGDPLRIAMDPIDAQKWFGMIPPDLSLEARVHSPDWIYNYLLTFYVDPSRPWGVNNLVFPATAMPDVLVALQGKQMPIYTTRTIMVEGKPQEIHVITGLQLAEPGSMTVQQYDDTVRDIVNFLTYVSEPTQIERQRIGGYVLLFLFILLILTFFLKKEFWNDVKK